MPPHRSTDKADHRDKLRSLKRKMEGDENLADDLFFFPERDGVNGYLGTDPVWFVGSKPSTGKFYGEPDRLLYSTLREHGFGNAHITDISKERGPVPDATIGIPPNEVLRMRPYFREEIQILEPDLLIAMGRYVQQALKYMEVTDGIEIGYVHHYSWAAGPGDKDVFKGDVYDYADRSN